MSRRGTAPGSAAPGPGACAAARSGTTRGRRVAGAAAAASR
jgi:hypothetical protein